MEPSFTWQAWQAWRLNASLASAERLPTIPELVVDWLYVQKRIVSYTELVHYVHTVTHISRDEVSRNLAGVLHNTVCIKHLDHNQWAVAGYASA